MSAVVFEGAVSPLPEGYFGVEWTEETEHLLQEALSEDRTAFDRLWTLNNLVKQGFAQEVIAEDDRHIDDARVVAEKGYYTSEYSCDSLQASHQGMSYNNLTYKLGEAEGVSLASYFDSEWMNMHDGNEVETGHDRIPFDALWLMDNLANPDIAARHQELASKFMPLRAKILELSGYEPDMLGEQGMLRHYYGNRSGLRLREMGDYQKPFESILSSHDRLVPEYIAAFGDLYDKNPSSKFPEEYKAGVEPGYRKLVADATYAVAHHLSHGSETDIELPLNGQIGSGMRLKLDGDEPLILLETLSRAMSLIRHPSIYANDEVVPVVASKGFGIYRFVRTRRSEEPCILPVLLHARSRGAVSYDGRYEYGRNGEGVEATFGYVIDPYLEDGKLIEAGKHKGDGPDNRISIRLDREGWAPSDRHGEGVQRDPTQSEGTVSLDIGSVLGREDWLGVKLGRLLAWGNMLRTEAEGKGAQLNHVTEYFDSSLGDADTFARSIEQFCKNLEQQTADSQRLAKLFSGRVAVKGAL